MIPVSHPVAGALLAVGSAILYNSGFVLEKQALRQVTSIQASRPVHMARSLVGSTRWLVGFVVLLAGLVLQIAALTMAPISLVQPIFASGLLLLLVLSHLHLGEHLSRPELCAIALVVAAVACLGASLGHGGDTAGWRANLGGLLLLALPTLAIAGWCLFLAGRGHVTEGEAGARSERLATALYGLSSGLAYGVASVATKAVAADVERRGVVHALPRLVGSPAVYLLGITSLAGLVVFQVGLQRSSASILVPVSNVTSSTYAVIVGSLLFSEKLPSAGWQAGLRVVGLVGVLVGVAALAARKPATV